MLANRSRAVLVLLVSLFVFVAGYLGSVWLLERAGVGSERRALAIILALAGQQVWMAVQAAARPGRLPAVRDGVRRCVACGHPVTGIAPGAAGAIRCPECGSETAVVAYETAEAAESAARPDWLRRLRRHRRVLQPLGVTLVVVALLGVGFVASRWDWSPGLAGTLIALLLVGPAGLAAGLALWDRRLVRADGARRSADAAPPPDAAAARPVTPRPDTRPRE